MKDPGLSLIVCLLFVLFFIAMKLCYVLDTKERKKKNLNRNHMKMFLLLLLHEPHVKQEAEVRVCVSVCEGEKHASSACMITYGEVVGH